MTKKPRIVEMDVLRGLAICAVIAIHAFGDALVTASPASISTVSLLTANQIARFGVPAFLFLSGLGLGLSSDGGTFLATCGRRLSKVLPLFFLWSVVFVGFTIMSGTGPMTVTKALSQIVAGQASYHLYYVPLIVFFYVVFPLLRRFFTSSPGVSLALGITVVNQIAGRILEWPFLQHQQNPLNWLVYFAGGVWFAERVQLVGAVLKRHPVAVSASWLVVTLAVIIEAKRWGTVTSMRPSVIVLTAAVVATVWSWDWGGRAERVQRALAHLSRWSYGMYLSHVLVLRIVYFMASRAGVYPGSVPFAILAFAAALVGSIVLGAASEWAVEAVNVRLRPRVLIKQG